MQTYALRTSFQSEASASPLALWPFEVSCHKCSIDIYYTIIFISLSVIASCSRSDVLFISTEFINQTALFIESGC